MERSLPDTLLKAIVDIYTHNKILIKFNNYQNRQKLTTIPPTCFGLSSQVHCTQVL